MYLLGKLPSLEPDIRQLQVVRHVVCGNPLCCNPRHLAIGSAADNANDTIADGSTTRKLSPELLQEVLALKGKETAGDIAARFGVTDRYVYDLWNGAVNRSGVGPDARMWRRAMPLRKLKPGDYDAIRSKRPTRTSSQLAREYGVDPAYIRQIWRSPKYAHKH
jgi:hypothetical protein